MRKPAVTLFGAILFPAVCAGAPAYADGGTILGTGMGAAVGGFLGSHIGKGSGKLAATGAGVAVGGLIGHEIGREIDSPSSVPATSAPVAAPSLFSDSPPVQTYEPNYVAPPAPPPTYVDPQAGTYCRPYSQEIRIDGEIKESYGTACLQPDGTWRIVP